MPLSKAQLNALQQEGTHRGAVNDVEEGVTITILCLGAEDNRVHRSQLARGRAG